MWLWESPNNVIHNVEENGVCTTCGRHHNKPAPDTSMPTAFGVVSSIAAGIAVKARVALTHPLANEENTEGIYREALTRILAEAERADGIWSRYINRELPEHVEEAKE
jgi:hypothetical protein